MSVVFDTGSNWLTVKSSMCTNCLVRPYNTHSSPSGHSKPGTTGSFELKYGSADLTGTSWLDTVCINKPASDGLENCIESFNFMAITSNTGLSFQIDGILGLGAEATSGPSFMENLRASGKIDDAMVSFELGFYHKNSKLTTPSSVTFGGYDKTKF